MSITLTIQINDIDNLSPKEKDLFAMIAADSVNIQTETSLSMEVPDIMDNIEPLSIEPVLSCVEEDPVHQLGDNYIGCTGQQGASVFGLASVKDFYSFVRSGAPFVQKISGKYNKYAIDRQFLERANCSPEEIESFKQGGKLGFPAWMTLNEVHKNLKKAGIDLRITISHGAKTIYGAEVYSFSGSKARKRRLINPRDWKHERPTYYDCLKKAF